MFYTIDQHLSLRIDWRALVAPNNIVFQIVSLSQFISAQSQKRIKAYHWNISALYPDPESMF